VAVKPDELSVHDWSVVPEYAVHGLDDAQVGEGPHETTPPLLLPPPLLLLLLPPHAADSPSVTHTGFPAG
jgi:hypothetical protein